MKQLGSLEEEVLLITMATEAAYGVGVAEEYCNRRENVYPFRLSIRYSGGWKKKVCWPRTWAIRVPSAAGDGRGCIKQRHLAFA